MRINTDGKYEYREDVIQRAAERWGCNKTAAIVRSCEYSVRIQDSLDEALEHPDMTEELAAILSTSNVNLRFERDTAVEID